MARNIFKISKYGSPSPADREKYFEEIYEQYFHRLYAYSKAIVDSQSLAKDVVSELFLNLWSNETDFSKIENIEMYLFISARNLSIQVLKRSNRFKSTEGLSVKLETVDYIDPEELLLEKELLSLIEKSIAQLPPQCQLIFDLSRKRNMKNAEIAVELGISSVTVKSQLRKAQQKLRAEITHFYHDHEEYQFSDVRLIGTYLILFGIDYYDIFN